MAKGPPPEEPKKGAPAYMVSFGDMMSLILCFFILLVSLSQQRDFGLMASGVGSFITALQSHGLPGLLTENEKHGIFENVRRRFNLPPEEDPARRELHVQASQFELVSGKILEAMAPHDELLQPNLVLFEADSSSLAKGTTGYLDRLAPTLRPVQRQLLVLEGHATDAGPKHQNDNQLLAFLRANTIRNYLIENHGYRADRVEARAWLSVPELQRDSMQTVDARLITSKQKVEG